MTAHAESVAPEVPSFALSMRSPAVRGAFGALVAGVSFLLAGAALEADTRLVLRALAIALCVAAAAEDIPRRRIRNAFTAPALVLALLGSAEPGMALLGMLLAPLPLLALAFLSPGGMGLGDVKLAAVIGALVGLAAVPPWWFGMALAGGVVAVLAFVRGGRNATIPYGPALVAGLLLVLL